MGTAQKALFRLSLVICVAGLILSLGEIYRKSNHKDKVLAEMAIVIDEVKNAPKTIPVYDSEGVQIQSEAEVKALTASYRMDCMTQVVSSEWKVPLKCEPVITSILKDPIDKKDLSFKPKSKAVFIGIVLALAPFYFLVIRGFFRMIRRKS